MGRIYLAALKLAIALMCVGLCILVIAHWAGMLPGADETAARRRRDLVDLVVALTVDDIADSRWSENERRLQRVVDRHDDLLSIGVRRRLGELVCGTRRHDAIWNTMATRQTSGDVSTGVAVPNSAPADRTEALIEQISSSDDLDPIVVDVSIHHEPWGQVEFAYASGGVGADTWFGSPLVRLLVFYALVGTSVYAVFVIRILGIFKQTQVVPEHVRGALDTLAEGLLLLDDQSRIIFANRAFAKSVDSSPRRLQGVVIDDLDWQPHVDDDNPSGDEDRITSNSDSTNASMAPHPWSVAARGGEQQTGVMLQLPKTQAEPTIFSINVTPLQQHASTSGSSGGVLVTFRDVTLEQRHKNELQDMLRLLGDSRDEIEQKNRRLEILATRDSLTGCLNRRAFFERFDDLWARSRGQSTSLATMMIDIDHFKSVNDTYGHHTGDEVLRAVSSVLRDRHDDDGIVCRYGGEEFCVLLPGYDVESAAAAAEQTRIAITKLLFDDPSELRLTASLGISELRFEPADPQALINQADACLYVAKREGRNRVIVYNPSMAGESDQAEVVDGLGEDYQLPTVAINALMRTLSHRDPSIAESSRKVANRVMQWTEHLLPQESRHLLEISALLHRIDHLADAALTTPDDNDGRITADQRVAMTMRRYRTRGETLQQIVDCLQNEHLSHVLRDFVALMRDADCSPREIGPMADTSPRMMESQWLFLAVLYESVGGDHQDTIDATLRLAGGLVDADVIQHLRVQTSASGEFAFGILQLQQHISQTIAAALNDLRQSTEEKDADRLRESLQRLDEFSSQSNLAEIQSSIEALRQDVQDHFDCSLDELCENDRWDDVTKAVDTVNRVCRDVQDDFMSFSMQTVQTTSAPRIESMPS